MTPEQTFGQLLGLGKSSKRVEARFEPESPTFLPKVEETPELWPEESHPLWHPGGRLRPRRADEVAAPERLQQGGKRTPNPMVPSLPKVGSDLRKFGVNPQNQVRLQIP